MSGWASDDTLYEAIWAICMYLDQYRNLRNQVTKASEGGSDWYVFCRLLDFLPVNAENQPVILVYIRYSSSHEIIGFQIGKLDTLENLVNYFLHDGICRSRRPFLEGNNGLIWELPGKIQFFTNPTVEGSHLACEHSISIKLSDGDDVSMNPSLLEWAKDLSGSVLPYQILEDIFDHYLQQNQGYGPKQILIKRRREWYSLVGYQRDPCRVFPHLLRLLPCQPCRNQTGGKLSIDRVDFQSDQLVDFEALEVSARVSDWEPIRTAWVSIFGVVIAETLNINLKR